MKVLFIAPYPLGESPSQRFRFEQYLSFLEQRGIHCRLTSFWSMRYWKILYHKGKALQKLTGILSGFIRRFFLLFTLGKYDFIFLHREATPIGPPVIEWIITKVLRKKVIYDFDDAIWLPNVSAVNSIANRLKWYGKVKHICKWAYKVSCGNDYLCTYARRFNPNVFLIPTTIDTSYHKPVGERKENGRLVIGWTGSQSTVDYLQSLIPVLSELEKTFDFEFHVISNKNPEIPLRSFRFVPWKKDTEIDDLHEFHIGVMPLPDNEWAKGKCGFKGLQYMALEIPTLMSPVGVNTQIISHGKNGFLVSTDKEWLEYLTQLLQSADTRREMGKAGRQTIMERYSVLSQQPNYLSLFK